MLTITKKVSNKVKNSFITSANVNFTLPSSITFVVQETMHSGGATLGAHCLLNPYPYKLYKFHFQIEFVHQT